MADADVPEDLVRLKIAVWAVEARCAMLREQMQVADAQRRERLEAELYLARGRRSTAIAEMYAHPWWASQPSRRAGDLAVNEAARARGVGPTAPSA
jgi:hypothetical protein